ncbi:baculoviral IAP repeat-containing protein 7 isoform X2 [Eulemur rufifrons]|uniref:baculoviral IAP repeat-containing protein 7 isoform X2 n=1 Tax=Eulemur rufifrons TaxID=859984 RepID=UPI003742D2F9
MICHQTPPLPPPPDPGEDAWGGLRASSIPLVLRHCPPRGGAGPAAPTTALAAAPAGPRDLLWLQSTCDPARPLPESSGRWTLPHPGHLVADCACPHCTREGPGFRSQSRAGWTCSRTGHPGPISASDLVRAGVASMGPEDRAKGLCCGPEPSRWAAGDSPTQENCRPHCLCGHDPGRGPWRARDHVDGQILGQLHPLAEEEEAEGARAPLPEGPAFPGMGSEEVRLASFYDWPPTTGVWPETLAAAGFFYTGQQDKVRCFFCYGGLQSWKQGDDPWTEHAKWFPRCPFLLQSKGRDFVHSAREARPRLRGSWDSWEEPEDPALTIPPAPVHGQPEQLTPRREAQTEGAREPGAGAVEEQLRQLQQERTCKVCLDRAVSVVFVPCGHLACAECAPSLQLCPICRAPVHSRVRTFLS